MSNVSVAVPVSCNITSTLDIPHAATINPGQYKEDIGTTTFKVFCNDNTGYAIYAIGYSNDEYGNTDMLPTNPSASTNPSIVTGTATSGNTSNWSMKLNYIDGTYKPTIENGFNSYKTIPGAYTKVASFNTNTDFTIGSSFQSTYKVFISQAQPADTYTGKVKYTLVHPHDADPPIDPSKVAYLDTGPNVWGKTLRDFYYEKIDYSDQLPPNFVPSEDNTISVPESPNPVYFYTDSNTYTLYYYTQAEKILLNADSSTLFYDCLDSEACYVSLEVVEKLDTRYVENMSLMFGGCTVLDYGAEQALTSWDVSNVTDMSNLFNGVCGDGHYSTIKNLSVLENWNTSNVTNMAGMFAGIGIRSPTTNIDALSNWNTSSVTDMGSMFSGASSLTNIDALAGWNTSKVTNMGSMFYGASSLANIDGASNWNTSSVTNMGSMFRDASSLTNIDGASNWNTSSVTNMFLMFYGTDNIDATVLNSWDVSKVTNKSNAFTCPTNKRPCWYNYTTCPTNSGNNTGNSISQTNSTNQDSSPSYGYNSQSFNNSLNPTSSPDSNSVTPNSSPNNNTYGNAPSQTPPQGEISRKKSKNDYLKLLPLWLIIISLLAFIMGIIFFLLKRRKDKENEEDESSSIT